MPDSEDFTLRIAEPVNQRVAQVRSVEGDIWENIDLPIAEALDVLEARVTNLRGQMEFIAESVQQLAAELPSSGTARAQRALLSRIGNVEGSVEAVSAEVTAVEASVTAGDAASAKALDALEVRVESNEGGITTNASDITALTIVVDGKAETTALDALTTRVTTAEGEIDVEQTKVTNLQTTIATKADTSVVTAVSNRVTSNTSGITVNQRDISNLQTTVAEKADTTALDALTTRVTTAEDEIDVEQTKVTNLQTTIATKADTSAVTALTSRVTATEGEIDTAQSDITTLQTTITGKAETTALDALTTRVTAAEGEIDTEQTKVTNLQTTIATKADTTALTALTNRVTTNASGISTHTAQITSLEARLTGTTLGPEQNEFTGSTRAEAETARDTYATANPTWLASYDADDDINIRLTWGVLRVFQRRVENAWVDTGEVEPTASAVTSLNATVAEHETEIDANASNITSLTSSLGDKANASALQALETRVTSTENVDGTTTLSQLARWLVKTQVGDLVGGVGLYNDGTSVDFIISADRLAVVPAGWEGADDERGIPFAITIFNSYSLSWTAFSGATGYQWRESVLRTGGWSEWFDVGTARTRTISDEERNLRFQVRALPTNRLSNIVTFIPDDTDVVAPSFPAPQLTVTLRSRSVVYFDVGMIKDASIGSAAIGNAVITNAHIRDATIGFAKIVKGDVFNLTVDNIIKSGNFRAGSAGWRLNKNGNAEFNDAVFRGDIESNNYLQGARGWRIGQDGFAEFDASSIRGTLTAEHIDSDVRNVEVIWNQPNGVTLNDHTVITSFNLTSSMLDFTYIDGVALNLGGDQGTAPLRIVPHILPEGTAATRPGGALRFGIVVSVEENGGATFFAWRSVDGTVLYVQPVGEDDDARFYSLTGVIDPGAVRVDASVPIVTYSDVNPDPGDRVTASFTSTAGITAYQWEISHNNGTTWADSTATGNATRTVTIAAGGANIATTQYRITWTRLGNKEIAPTVVSLSLGAAVAPGVSISGASTVASGGTVTLTRTLTGGTYDGTPATVWALIGSGSLAGRGDTAQYTAPTLAAGGASVQASVGAQVTVSGAGTRARRGSTARRTATHAITVTAPTGTPPGRFALSAPRSNVQASNVELLLEFTFASNPRSNWGSGSLDSRTLHLQVTGGGQIDIAVTRMPAEADISYTYKVLYNIKFNTVATARLWAETDAGTGPVTTLTVGPFSR